MSILSKIEDRSTVLGIGFSVYPSPEFQAEPYEFAFLGSRVMTGRVPKQGEQTMITSVRNPERFGPMPGEMDMSKQGRKIARAWVEAFVSEWEQGCIASNHGHEATCSRNPCTCS